MGIDSSAAIKTLLFIGSADDLGTSDNVNFRWRRIALPPGANPHPGEGNPGDRHAILKQLSI